MTTIPASMTAIGIRGPGGPEVLVPEERPVPTPGPGEILVAVKAAGVNRPDVMQRKGLYPPPKGAPDIPGLEVAGEVAIGVFAFLIVHRDCSHREGGAHAQCGGHREGRKAA